MTVWIPGALANPQASGARGHWSKHATIARRQREKAQTYLLLETRRRGQPWSHKPEKPKTITFTAYVHNAYDDDNIRAALKPTRDALKDMLVIDDDRPSAGHHFIYDQVVSRGKNAKRGVEIRIALEESR